MEENSEKFNYTYSAREQEEIKHIREKYAPSAPEENKMEQLRRLDASAVRPGPVVSLVVRIISTFLFGIGMCCTMVWTDKLFIPGIFIGVIGIIGITAAYPIYIRMVKKRRKKLAPEILRLSDELMK